MVDDKQKGSSLINLLIPPKIKEVKISEVLPCLTSSERIRVVGTTNEKLDDLLPAIYLYLPQATYNKQSESMSFMFEEHLITIFGAGKITVTNLRDREEAENILRYVKELLNRASIYVNRHGKPSPELIGSKTKLSPLEINNFLPKKDCGECGVSTCYGFAIKLATGENSPRDCPYLSSEKFVELQKKIHVIQI
ncbi:MAG: (Fe-S)-binding protein [Candidatus Jordarchaeum sp.]|uniref:(Fe-S)-binding protein n=1 Tax=Candidatus Jordarchaeum sp. TaxID=2823881 RepID=UPI00404B8016